MAGSQSGFIWYELMTTDTAGARGFYQHVVGDFVLQATDPTGAQFALVGARKS